MFNSFFYKCVLSAVLLGYFHLAGLMAAANEDAAFRPLPPEQSLVRVDYYFVPGCDECSYVENNILPQLREIFAPKVRIFRHNLFSAAEFSEARNLLKSLAIQREDNVFVVIDREIYIGGRADISQNMILAVERRLSSGLRPVVSGPAPAGDWKSGGKGWVGKMLGEKTLSGNYFFSFPFLVILAAGILDGLNPCAFAVIVFLVTLLLAGGERRGYLLATGVGFCGAVYLTYFLIGLGLFQVFRLSLARYWLNNIVHWFLIVGLLIMAVVSFRDALLFRLRGRPTDVLLKLPDRITRLVHRVIRANLPRRYFFGGGFLLGIVVTILESICTGQLYLPALAYLARSSPFWLQAVAGLALYNLMFITPLIAVFILGYWGMGSFAFMAWSRKNVFWAKWVMGCFFVFLAAVLYLT